MQKFADVTQLHSIGGKAKNLVLLSRAGLPVPKGYCIPTSVYTDFLRTHKLPESLLEQILETKKQLGGKIAIRSSANCEDGTQLSMAGVFKSEYVYEDSQVLPAIESIYKQAQSQEVLNFLELHDKTDLKVHMGIIIQELIEPEYSGVIYTQVNGDNLLVQYVDGLGARLVDGEVSGSSFILQKNGYIHSSSGFELRPISEKIQEKIITTTSQIEMLFPNHPQDIEFATRGDELFILQARTLTTELGVVTIKQSPNEALEETKLFIKRYIHTEKKEMGIKTAIFSDSNYSELLPKPAPMDIGIYKYISGGSDGIVGATQIGRSQMGYLVSPHATGIIHYIGGRTYFSIARNAAIYHIGFPESATEYFETLVNEYLDEIENDTQKAAYPQMGLYLQDPTLEDLQKRFGKKASEYFAVYNEFVKKLNLQASSFLEEFKTIEEPKIENFIKKTSQTKLQDLSLQQLAEHSLMILEHIRTETYVSFVKSARLGFYYSQRLRSLFSDELYSQLNQGLDGSAITESNIAIANAKSQSDALEIAQEKIGHMSTGEMLEIRHQPLRDNPQKLLAYVKGIRQTGTYASDFEKQKQIRLSTQENVLQKYSGSEKKEIATIVKSSQTYMALRETIKYLFTKEYLLVRDILEEISKRLKLKSGDIYYIYPRELPSFVLDHKKMMHLIMARKEFFMNAEEFDLPSVILEHEVANLSLKNDEAKDFSELQGQFLAHGETFVGTIVNSDEFSDLDEVSPVIQKYKKAGDKIVLVSKQMNLSHDPLIVQADGLIIENAGLVAHGAQRARELGKGAIGGLKSSMLKTGTKIEFDPKKQIVRKVLK